MPSHGNSNGHRGDDDGCWGYIEGIGRVRTGPRGRHPGPPTPNRLSPPSRNTIPNRPRLNHQHSRPQTSSLNQDRDYIRAQRDVQIQSDEDLEKPPDSASRVLPEYHNHLQYLTAGFASQRQRLSHTAEQQRSQPSLSSPQGLGNRNSDVSYPIHIEKERTDDGKCIKSEDAANDEVGSFPSIDERRQRDPSIGTFSRQESAPPQKPISPQNDQDDGTEDSISPPDREHEPSPDSDPSPNLGDSEKPGCICPIGHECEAKTNELIDCRTLVLEKGWGKWLKNQDKPYPSILAPDLEPEDETFMTLPEVQKAIKLLDKIETKARMSVAIRTPFEELTKWVRKAQTNSVTRDVLEQSFVLDRLKAFLSDDYAPVRENKAVPIHIVENLTSIFRKWEFGDLSVLARRGLIQRKEQGQFYPDPSWPYARDANYFGHGHLINGQTWRTRVEMRRDGAHAPLIAGIFGTTEEGAKSIVMGFHDEEKKEFYADIDQGTRIWYMGTARNREKDDKEPTNIKDPDQQNPGMVHLNEKGHGPTPGTNALITSYRTKRPVRVFRSSRLAGIVKDKPVKGFRYDGLYEVVNYELLKVYRQIYRFEMVRLTDGQGPLRENLPPNEPRGKKRRREVGELSD